MSSNTAVITMQIWATVTTTNVFNSAHSFGMQSLAGRIIGAGGSTNIKGSMSGVTASAPFNFNSVAGTVQDLNSDGSFDLGGTSTSNVTGDFVTQSDNTNSSGDNGGSGAFYYMSNNASGSTPSLTLDTNMIKNSNGYSFLMGTATFTLANTSTMVDPSTPMVLAYNPYPTGSIGVKSLVAKWLEDGTKYSASSTNVPAAGLTLSIYAVPEPGTWAMLLGGMGMLALGKRFRRVS